MKKLLGVIGIVALLVVVMGCDKDRDAIVKYGKGVDDANLVFQKLQKEMDDMFKLQEVPKIKAALDDKVIPLMDEYVTKLKAIPVETPKLQEIHALMIEAEELIQSNLKTFSTELTDQNFMERLKSLQDQLDEATKKEEDYEKKLETYYSEHGVVLKK